MKITEIYEKYEIMPSLQEHMLRVAGVASLIANNYEKPLDKMLIITTALLHDAANIIKFDNLERFPQSTKPQGLTYWKKVRKHYIERYGVDEHLATLKIVDELMLNSKVKDILQNLEFADSKTVDKTNNINKKIVKYSDLRVSPYEVDSFENRIKEAKIRYVVEKKKWTEDEFDSYASIWKRIETQIFAHCNIRPEDITEEKVQAIIPDLKNFDIKTHQRK